MDKVENYRKQFGEKLKYLMQKREISNNKLASILNIERSTITQYTKGETTPKIDIFLALCETLTVKPEYFLDESVKFKDYYNLKEKSLARKSIESIYTLLATQVLRINPEENVLAANEIWKYNYFGIYLLNKITEECYRFATSDILDDSDDMCERIVNKYEKELNEYFSTYNSDKE